MRENAESIVARRGFSVEGGIRIVPNEK